MKKTALILTALLVLALALALTACGGETVSSETKPPITQIETPEGYVLYNNGDISFAYPEAFSKTEDAMDVLSDLTNDNNITVVYEEKTDIYEKMDNDEYESRFKPILETLGMTITKYNVEQLAQNASGVPLTKVTHTTSVEGIVMDQTMLILTVGDKTYTVTVTEVVSDNKLVSTVIDSLIPLK